LAVMSTDTSRLCRTCWPKDVLRAVMVDVRPSFTGGPLLAVPWPLVPEALLFVPSISEANLLVAGEEERLEKKPPLCLSLPARDAPLQLVPRPSTLDVSPLLSVSNAKPAQAAEGELAAVLNISGVGER